MKINYQKISNSFYCVIEIYNKIMHTCVCHTQIYVFTYPCLSSEIESSISAIFKRLKPPTLKLIPTDDLLLKFPLSVNPCKSNVPNGFFFAFDAFASFKFNVKFCRKRIPPRRKIYKNNY